MTERFELCAEEFLLGGRDKAIQMTNIFGKLCFIAIIAVYENVLSANICEIH